MQGWRRLMEDAHVIIPEFSCEGFESRLSIFGVFDGHRGPAVSCWTAIRFEDNFRSELKQLLCHTKNVSCDQRSKHPGIPCDVMLICEVLQRMFLAFDAQLQRDENRTTLKYIHQAVEYQERHPPARQSRRPARPKVRFVPSLLSGRHGSSSPDDSHGKDLYETSSDRPCLLEKRQCSEDHYTNDGSLQRTASQEGSLTNTAQDQNGVTSSDQSAPAHDAKRRPLLSQVHHEVPGGLPKLVQTLAYDKNLQESRPPAVLSTNVVEMDGPLPENFATDTADRLLTGLHDYDPEACGTTAVIAVVVRGHEPMAVIANCGDSRAVLSRSGVAIPLSQDHKPDKTAEKMRIISAGGQVINGRVDGALSLSRAVGDLMYKQDKLIPQEQQKIISLPDIRVLHLRSNDQFMVLACDGIWDCLTNQQAVDFIASRLNSQDHAHQNYNHGVSKLSTVCGALCDTCFCEDPLTNEQGTGCDNMTVILVQFGPSLFPSTSEENDAECTNPSAIPT